MRRIVLSSLLLLLTLGSASAAIVRPAPSQPGDTAYKNDAIGVSLQQTLPDTKILEDQYLSEALGFTVVDPEGRMVLRVAWRHRDAPTQMEQRARELVQTPGLSLDLRPIRIGLHRGIMLTGAPGIDPSTYVYLVAYDRLYELVCPEREGGIEACMALFHSLSFHPTARSPEALGLKKAEDALYEEPPLLETPEPKGSLDTDMGMSW